MSEYVTVEVEYGGDANIAELYVNQVLTSEGEEHYRDPAAGDLGSPIAQMLYTAVEGIIGLTISEDCLTVQRDPDYPWEAIIDEVRDALRDWYL